MNKIPFTIRPVERCDDLRQCAELQRIVWQFEEKDVVSPRMLALCIRHGGIVLGARVEGKGLVGFVFSLPLPWNHRMIQHSHMLAVLPSYRDLGIGYALKQAQRGEALRKCYPLISWTFDPLEAKNANLNLNKLGVVVRHYYVNLYGEHTSSTLHKGLGTDRFLAEWTVTGPKGSKPASAAPEAEPPASLDEALQLPLALEAREKSGGLFEPGTVRSCMDEPRILVEVPVAIQELKSREPSLARRWREATRQAFLDYLTRSYVIRRLPVFRDRQGAPRRAFYMLEKDG